VRSLADWLEQQQKSHPRAIDLTLDRVREVAHRLDLLTPAHRVITVGGTNGKGSTVACIDAVLRAHGVRCGRFTSPHLTRYNERICVDGVEASDAELIESFERIDAARSDVTLTFFEYNALAAFDRFRTAGVDAAVLEVGLGGRFDATNILDADAAVVCSIGLDHMDLLGDSLDDIAREKAGIFRRGRPAVIGSPDVPEALRRAAAQIGAHVVAAGRDFHVRETQDGGGAWSFELGDLRLAPLPDPAIRGLHQRGNAATALAAIASAGIERPQTSEKVSQALRDVRLRGRFQVVPGEHEWVLDVAHNVPAAQALSLNLRGLQTRRTIAVCGILADKDIAGIASALRDDIDAWILVELEGPRALRADGLEARLPPGARVMAQAPDVASGCRVAREAAQRGDRILVFGSFLTVGPALDFLGI
jgi:dihydrofolate synthase / folylpolyglutamate synthase